MVKTLRPACALYLLAALPLQAQPVSKAIPVRLSPQNPHYFLYQGKTVALITSGEHYGAVLNAGVDYKRYLDAIAAAGLNYTRIFGGSYVEVPGKSFGIQRNDLAPEPGMFIAPWVRSEVPGYAGGGNKFDLERWNPDYFERLHSFLAEAQKRGIVVELTMFSSHYGEAQWAISPFNAANNVNGGDAIDYKKVNTSESGKIPGWQERYTRKLVKETKAYPNVIYEICNEPWSDRSVKSAVINPYLQAVVRDRYPNSIDLPDAEAMAWQRHVAEWIESEEYESPNRHLVAQNYSNFQYPVMDLLPGVSMVNFHYAYPEAVSLNYGLNKAIAYDETGFLGRDDAGYIRQAWNFMLSGGSAFDALDYSFSPGHEDGLDAEPNGPGGGSAAFRRSLRALSEFMAALPLAGMTPDTKTVVHASGVYVHALSGPNGVFAAYLDGDGPCGLTLRLTPGSYMAKWIDPRTGASTGTQKFRLVTGDKTFLVPAFKDGIALQLKRAIP